MGVDVQPNALRLLPPRKESLLPVV